MLLPTLRLTVALQIFSFVRQQCCQRRYCASQCAAAQFGASQLVACKPQLCMNHVQQLSGLVATDSQWRPRNKWHFLCTFCLPAAARALLLRCHVCKSHNVEYPRATSCVVHVALMVYALDTWGFDCQAVHPEVQSLLGDCRHMHADVNRSRIYLQLPSSSKPLAADAGCYPL